MNLGIIGGGQLGRMLTLAGHRLGIKVYCLDPKDNCPAAQVGATQIVGELSDVSALTQLVKVSDVITWEIEHIDPDAINKALATNPSCQVQPKVETLQTIQDKYKQKLMLEKSGIAVAPFSMIDSHQAIISFFNDSNNGIIIKSRFGGYDGRGNFVINKEEDIDLALSHFNSSIDALYMEQLVNFEKEISVIAARGSSNQTQIYDPVDTFHLNNICERVIAPSQSSSAVIDEAEFTAKQVMKQLNGQGVFAIEMFLTSNNNIFVNEIAPRVHNSGHHTIEACHTSQFENHVRAVCGLPLGDAKLKVKKAVMKNILGQKTVEDFDEELLSQGLATPNVSLHWYGKSPVKKDRKMGHLTIVTNDDDQGESAIQIIEQARQAIDI